MSFPPSWTRLAITGKYADQDGNPVQGYVLFQSPTVIACDGTMITPMAIEFPLDVNGQFTGQLPATNDTDCTPNGWAWKVSERVPGGREYYILADKDGGAIDLSTAAPLVDLPDVGEAVQGPPGPQGPAGPTGPAGPDGATGATGPAGNSLTRPFASLSISSGVVTVDLGAGNEVFDLALSANVTSWNFTNLPAAGKVAEIRVDTVQHASSAKTCVSPATAGRTAGGAWVQSATLSARESLGLAIDSAGNVSLYPSGVLA